MRGVISFILLSSLIFGRYWDYQFNIELKKDQVSSWTIFDNIRNKTFSLRWTLYINGGLIVLSNYDGFPYQHILYKSYNRNSFQIPLSQKRSTLMVEFTDFNENNRTATFRVLFKNSRAEQIGGAEF